MGQERNNLDWISDTSAVVVMFPPGILETFDILISSEPRLFEHLSRVERSYQCKAYPTQLVVLRRKYREPFPYTHTSVAEAKLHPERGYVAVVTGAELKRLHRKADRQWRSKWAKLERRVARYTKPATLVDILFVPGELRARIRLDANGCWLWRNTRTKRVRRREYGHIQFKGKRWAAHRLMYTLLVGAIPKGALLLHECDVPACVNPEHLRPGSLRGNYDDMIGKGRADWQKRNAVSAAQQC